MKAAYILAELKLKGFTGARIAADLQITRQTVQRVIQGQASSRRVARRIAEVTGIPVAVLWPGRYAALELAELRSNRKAA